MLRCFRRSREPAIRHTFGNVFARLEAVTPALGRADRRFSTTPEASAHSGKSEMAHPHWKAKRPSDTDRSRHDPLHWRYIAPMKHQTWSSIRPARPGGRDLQLLRFRCTLGRRRALELMAGLTNIGNKNPPFVSGSRHHDRHLRHIGRNVLRRFSRILTRSPSRQPARGVSTSTPKSTRRTVCSIHSNRRSAVRIF